MSSAIVDLSQYGNVKGRDIFARDVNQAVKGDGVSAAEITNTYFGINSATSTEQALASTTVSESAADSGLGTYTLKLHDGTALNEVLNVSPSGLNMFAGTSIKAATYTEDSLALPSTMTLSSDATAPTAVFTMDTTDVLEVTTGGVDIIGTLTVDGTDILSTITGGNAFQIDGTKAELKSDYTLLELNVLNAYTSAVALDVNGSIVNRGNSMYMYDVAGTSNLSTLSFDSASNALSLHTSLADQSGTADTLNVQTTNGTNDTYLTRLSFDGGLGDQNATFTNVNVGIGGAPTAGKKLDVTGEVLVTGGVVTTGDIDVSGSDLLNVSDITSSNALAEQATIALTSHITDPSMDFILGDLAATPTTAMTLTESAATINVATTVTDNLTITGDLIINGSTTTVNTANVNVEDKEIDLAYNATTHAQIDGGGITVGSATVEGLGVTLPTLLYDQTTTAWKTSLDMNVPDAKKFTVGAQVAGVSPSELSATGLDLNTDAGVIHMGEGKKWRIRVDNDGTSDHLYFEHDDAGNDVFVVKMDIMQ